MSRMEKRQRAVDESVRLEKTRKRRKVQRKPKESRSDSKATSREVAIIDGDHLRWKEVALPDRLEDAEGFFGLEEIENVQVVRDEGTKQIRFRTYTPNSLALRNSGNPQDTSIDDVRNDEWSGIEDSKSVDHLNQKASAFQNETAPTTSAAKFGVTTPFLHSSSANSPLKTLQMDVEADLPYSVLRGISAEPDVDLSAWSTLSLSDTLLAAIAGLGFHKPTPIQSATIPMILKGRDVVGKAVTGSGKTLAFGIPIFEHWLRSRMPTPSSGSDSHSPVALILSPTRELAHQISKHLTSLTELSPHRPLIATVTGGLSIHKQLRQLSDADIIVATPGRLWEVITGSQGLIARLKRIQFLVIDEADRLLSEGHFKEVEEILDALDREVVSDEVMAGQGSKERKDPRQTLVFSATFHKSLQQSLTSKTRKAGGDILNEVQSMEYLLKKLSFREKPTFIDVNPASQMAVALNEAILECGAMEKDLYLYFLLLRYPQAKTLVFTNSISSVKRVTPLLQNLDLAAVALHSTMPQKARLRSLERFSGQHTILIATDVAARGLDIKAIDLIIHYHVPRAADMYVHRSGRTARAEHSGRSILLCSPDEVAGVTRLIGKIHSGYHLESIQTDRGIVARLGPRLKLAQTITDATLAKEKAGTRDDWLRNAAEELGVDYDSEGFAEEGAKNSRGRGAGKSMKERDEKNSFSKAEIASMRAELKRLLQKRVNLGVSERYLAGGRVDMDALLENKGDKNFLGGTF